MSAHTSQTELKLIGKLILEGEMLCETGLHVGAGKGSLAEPCSRVTLRSISLYPGNISEFHSVARC